MNKVRKSRTQTSRRRPMNSRGNLFLSIPLLVLLSCATPRSQQIIDDLEDSWYTRFIDDDTMIVSGSGISRPGVKVLQGREDTAKEAARMDAMSKMRNTCLSIGQGECGRQDPEIDKLDLIIREVQKQKKIVRSKCTDEPLNPPTRTCRVLYEYKHKNLKKLCTGTSYGAGICA